MTTNPTQKGQGRKPPTVTAQKTRRRTVYVLPDGTPATGKPVTVQRRSYTPRARACKVCGTDFKPASKAAKYCSDACRAKAYRARQAADRADRPREIVVEALTCAHCGKGFFAVKGKGAQYCTGTCRASAYKARRAAAIAALADDLGISTDEAADALDTRGLKAIVAELTARGWLYDRIAHTFVLPMLGTQARIWNER